MNDPNPEEVIFAAARQLPPEDRAACLDQACGDNGPLRRRIEALLNASEQSGAFLEVSAAPTLRRTPAASIPLAEKPGDKVGRYKLLQQIGEGGCGVVYMAEQEEPVRRRVALKIIKLGMDTKSVIARFEAERQALAMMDHPNIAKVFDAGATETGRPYFVMELVRGMKITDYCDETRLSIRARLDLFMQICHAIQHAHQKGIIHRDIKPSNILVTVNDGVPVPKVIDFGIVKATGGQQLTDKTIFTAFEQFIGTPAYMSPEQAVLTSVDIDTRSDIYALGVLLYELLTGKTPFDAGDLLAAGLDELRRTIRETEPARPSMRLSTMPGNELSTTAQRRGLDAPKLVTELHGDLDWIVMKCVEKDRVRRYETANGLAMDIQRHLNNEPVVARPPNNFYRFQKLVRRNKLAFAAASAVIATLIIGLTVSAALFFKEKAARVRAVEAETQLQRALAEAKQQRDAALKQKQRADEQAEIAKAVKDFLQNDLLKQADSKAQADRGFEQQPDLTVKEALRRAAEKIGQRFTNQPLVEAEIRSTLGVTFNGLAEWSLAIPHLERAVALRKQTAGPDHPDTLASMSQLAGAYQDAGIFDAGRLKETLSLREEMLKLQKAKLGPDHPDTLATMSQLARAYKEAGRSAEALLLYEETLKLQKAKLGADHPDTLVTMNNLAIAYLDAGRLSEALQLADETLKLRKAKLGPEHPDTLGSMNNLANAYRRVGRLTEAVRLYEETLKLANARLGPDHPHTGWYVYNLIEAYRATGDLKEAERFFNETLTLTFASQPQSLGILRGRANFFASIGRWKEATVDFARIIDLNPDDHEDWHGFAAILVQTGAVDAYRENCRKSVERFANTTDPMTANRIAKDCLILPFSGANLELVSKMADHSLIRGTDVMEVDYTVKALAEYRQGRFTSAVDWAEKSGPRDLTKVQTWEFESSAPTLEVERYAVLAMGRYQLNQKELARAALASAQGLADNKLRKLEGGGLGVFWIDWIIAHALLREARALIEGSPEAAAEVK